MTFVLSFVSSSLSNPLNTWIGHPNFQTTSMKLGGENYLKWYHSVQMYTYGKGSISMERLSSHRQRILVYNSACICHTLNVYCKVFKENLGMIECNMVNLSSYARYFHFKIPYLVFMHYSFCFNL